MVWHNQLIRNIVVVVAIVVLIAIDLISEERVKATMRAYEIKGIQYTPKRVEQGHIQEGIASWYGTKFHGRKTSNGETYDMYAYTCAHKTLPMNTMVKVTNLENGKEIILRVNDRGPFVEGRIVDVSYLAGRVIGIDIRGIAEVSLEVLGDRDENSISVQR